MKAVMLSIQPRHCKNILDGLKKYEIRKTKLPLNTPVYVYCTRGMDKIINSITKKFAGLMPEWEGYKIRGKVVAKIEFDRVETINYQEMTVLSCDCGGYSINDQMLNDSCISYNELLHYGKEKPLYLHHISKVEILEKPMDIGEFYKAYNPKNKSDNFCSFEEYKERIKNGNLEVSAKLTRPPQSYCWVEI